MKMQNNCGAKTAKQTVGNTCYYYCHLGSHEQYIHYSRQQQRTIYILLLVNIYRPMTREKYNQMASFWKSILDNEMAFVRDGLCQEQQSQWDRWDDDVFILFLFFKLIGIF